MKKKQKVIKSILDVILPEWEWPYLRTNSNGDREYECPHGVGHGGIHGCCGSNCCKHPTYKKRIK